MKATYGSSKRKIAEEKKVIVASKKSAGMTNAQIKGQDAGRKVACRYDSQQAFENSGRIQAAKAFKSVKSQQEFFAGWMIAWEVAA